MHSSSVVEHTPSICEALGSVPGTIKKKSSYSTGKVLDMSYYVQAEEFRVTSHESFRPNYSSGPAQFARDPSLLACLGTDSTFWIHSRTEYS